MSHQQWGQSSCQMERSSRKTTRRPISMRHLAATSIHHEVTTSDKVSGIYSYINNSSTIKSCNQPPLLTHKPSCTFSPTKVILSCLQLTPLSLTVNRVYKTVATASTLAICVIACLTLLSFAHQAARESADCAPTWKLIWVGNCHIIIKPPPFAQFQYAEGWGVYNHLQYNVTC